MLLLSSQDGCAKSTAPSPAQMELEEGKGGAEWYAIVDSNPHLGADVPTGPKGQKRSMIASRRSFNLFKLFFSFFSFFSFFWARLE